MKTKKETSSLKTVEIGKYVKHIQDNMFANDTEIEVINCFCSTPPDYSSYQTFKEKVYNNAILYVPKGSLEAYKNHLTWGRFLNIVEGNITNGIDRIQENAPENRITSVGLTLSIKDYSDELVSIYSLDGRMIFQGQSADIELPSAGVYIVKVGGNTTKLMVN